MIFRIWHGWTTLGNADAYQRLLDATIVPGIIARGIPGLRGVYILRRCDRQDAEVEFVTVMTFDDWSAVEAFAGPDPAVPIVPPAAQQLLARYDLRSQHYDIIARHQASGSPSS